MQRLETNIAYLPVPYRCAVERLNDPSLRSFAMLRELCDGYAKTYGMDSDGHMHSYFCASAEGIAARRYGMFYCPKGYGECEDAGGCVYPGRCSRGVQS